MTSRSDEKLLPFLPGPQQELLLKACLLDSPEAVTAWQAWRESTPANGIDAGSQRLLPLLAHNVRRFGVRDPATDEYNVLQRRSWALNSLLFRAAELLFRRLEAAGIRAMALKGVALASSVYEHMSLRPMNDFDFLVAPEDGIKALELVERLNWQILPGQFRPRTQVEIAVRPACTFKDARIAEVEVDLHWRLLWGRYSSDAETALWEKAIAVEIGDTKCLAPCPTDMLVHVCAHGARWSEPPTLRWVADATLLVRTGSINWDHLLAQTKALGLSLPLHATLKYLRDTMCVPVPDTVIEHLSRTGVKRIERFLYEAELLPPQYRSFRSMIAIHRHIAWHELVRSAGPIGYLRYFLALLRRPGLRDPLSLAYERSKVLL